jgi:hypothetical protein
MADSKLKPDYNLEISGKSDDEEESGRELNKTKHAWKPTGMQTSRGAAVVDLDPHLERDVRSILNKLTLTNFDKLSKQFNKLPINTETKLKRCVEVIFEKVSC